MKIKLTNLNRPTFTITVSGDELAFLGVAVAAAKDFKGKTTADPYKMLSQISDALGKSIEARSGLFNRRMRRLGVTWLG